MAPRNFIVLTTIRSGSTWFMDVLNHQDDLIAYQELFIDNTAGSGKNQHQFIHSPVHAKYPRPISAWKYLNKIFYRREAVGFKIMYGQLYSKPEVLIYALSHQIPFIHLIRSNQFNTYLSKELVMQRTRHWHARRAESVAEETEPIHLPTEGLVAWLDKSYRNIERGRRLLKWLRIDHIEVHYEQLREDPGEFSRVFEFIHSKVPDTLPESRYRITRARSQKETIANYPKLRAVLETTPYAHLLDE